MYPVIFYVFHPVKPVNHASDLSDMRENLTCIHTHIHTHIYVVRCRCARESPEFLPTLNILDFSYSKMYLGPMIACEGHDFPLEKSLPS